MSYKDAAQSAGITPETLCRWIARGKVRIREYRTIVDPRSRVVHPPCLEVGAFQGGLCYYCLTRSNLCESPRQSRGFTCDN